MNGPFTKDLYNAVVNNINSSEDMHVWDVLKCKYIMIVIYSTWDLNLKRFPYRLMKIFKDCFCAQGYQKL